MAGATEDQQHWMEPALQHVAHRLVPIASATATGMCRVRARSHVRYSSCTPSQLFQQMPACPLSR